tara:strand:+ start:863 stop:1213 length:351 start_codon:yes stop_codon:yes gene_type:complete
MELRLKYFLYLLLIFPLFAQNVTFTREEYLQIANNIKQMQADSQRVAESLSICEELVFKMEEQSNVDSLLLIAKDSQITLLKARDEANEKMVKLIKPKWYENQYLWLGIGFILGKI